MDINLLLLKSVALTSVTAELDQHPSGFGIPCLQCSPVFEKQDRAWLWKGYFITENFVYFTNQNILSTIFTNFSCKVFFFLSGIYFYYGNRVFLWGKGDPEVCFDWKVAQRGKCIPVKLRTCWIMKRKGSQTPVLLYSYSTISPPGTLLVLDCRNLKGGTACYHLMLSRKNPTRICATLFHQITVILQISLSISPQNLRLQQQTRFGTARVEKHFRNKKAALFQRICHCPWNHNLSSRASKAVCSTWSFLVSKLGWVLTGMGEAELPAEVLLTPPPLPVTSRLKAQHSHSSYQPKMPFPLSCLGHTCPWKAETKLHFLSPLSLGTQTPSNCSRKDDLFALPCSMVLMA